MTGYLEQKVQELLTRGREDHVLLMYQQTEHKYTYHVLSYGEMMEKMHDASFVPRNWHEAIFSNRACKLYLDVEFYDISEQEGERRLMCILEEIWRRLIAVLGLDVRPDPLILDSSNPGKKYSVHVIYDTIWFDSPIHILELLHGMFPSKSSSKRLREEEEAPSMYFIDPHYPKPNSTNMWMRMPYSKKIPAGIPLLPRVSEACKYSQELFGRGCISLQRTSEPWMSLFPPPFHTYRIPLRIYVNPETFSGHVEMSGDGEDCTKEYAKAMVTYLLSLSSRGSKITLSGWKFQPPTLKWRVRLTPGLYCPNKNAEHKSNYMTLSSTDCKRVSYYCMDPECMRGGTYLEDYTSLAHPPALNRETIQKSLDWKLQKEKKN